MTSLFKQSLALVDKSEADLASLSSLPDIDKFAAYASLSEQMRALEEQVNKLALAKSKMVPSLDLGKPGGEEAYVPMYGPQHIERVKGLELRFAKLKEAFSLFPRPIAVPAAPPPEVVATPTPIIEAKIIQQSFITQQREQDKLALENRLLAQASKQRMRKDAVDVEMASISPEGKPLQDFAYYAALLPPSTKSSLGAILDEICKRPENAVFRTLKFSNNAFKTLLDSSEHMRPSLASLGFAPKYVAAQNREKEEEEEVMAYFLPEPNLERDFEAWSVWYDKLKLAADVANGRK